MTLFPTERFSQLLKLKKLKDVVYSGDDEEKSSVLCTVSKNINGKHFQSEQTVNVFRCNKSSFAIQNDNENIILHRGQADIFEFTIVRQNTPTQCYYQQQVLLLFYIIILLYLYL